MNTLLVYDSVGVILVNKVGDYYIPKGGSLFMEVEIPLGKKALKVDVTKSPHQVILENVKPPESEVLKQQVSELQDALVEVADMLVGGEA